MFASDLCCIAVASDGDSSSSSIDVQVLNHILDEAEHVHLEIVVVHVACRVYQKEYVSLLPARSSYFVTLAAYQIYINVRQTSSNRQRIVSPVLIAYNDERLT